MFSLESAHLAVSSSSKRMAQSSSRETNVNCLGSSDRTAALVDQKSGAQSRADRTLGVKCGMQVIYGVILTTMVILRPQGVITRASLGRRPAFFGRLPAPASARPMVVGERTNPGNPEGSG